MKNSLPQSYVYFFLNPTNQTIKIGKSFNIQKRIKDVSQKVSTDLVFMGYINGGFKEESKLHRQFQDISLGEEWFSYSDDLREYIQKNTHQEIPPIKLDIDLIKIPKPHETWDEVIQYLTDPHIHKRDRMWRQGDFIKSINAKYAGGIIQIVASFIGISYNTLRQYGWISEFYTEDMRSRYRDIPYTILRAVLFVDNPDIAMALLDECKHNRYTLAKINRIINERYGKTLSELVNIKAKVVGTIVRNKKTCLIVDIESLSDSDIHQLVNGYIRINK